MELSPYRTSRKHICPPHHVGGKINSEIINPFDVKTDSTPIGVRLITRLPPELQAVIFFQLTITDLVNIFFTGAPLREAFCQYGFKTNLGEITKELAKRPNKNSSYLKPFWKMSFIEKFHAYPRLRQDAFRTFDETGINDLNKFKIYGIKLGDLRNTLRQLRNGDIKIADLKGRSTNAFYIEILNHRRYDIKRFLRNDLVKLWIVDQVVITIEEIDKLLTFVLFFETYVSRKFGLSVSLEWLAKNVLHDRKIAEQFFKLRHERKYELSDHFLQCLINDGKIKIEQVFNGPCVTYGRELSLEHQGRPACYSATTPLSVFWHGPVKSAIYHQVLTADAIYQLKAEGATMLIYVLNQLEYPYANGCHSPSAQSIEDWISSVKIHFDRLPIYLKQGHHCERMLSNLWCRNYFENKEDQLKIYFKLPATIQERFYDPWLQKAVDRKLIEFEQMCTLWENDGDDPLRNSRVKHAITEKLLTVSDALSQPLKDLLLKIPQENCVIQ